MPYRVDVYSPRTKYWSSGWKTYKTYSEALDAKSRFHHEYGYTGSKYKVVKKKAGVKPIIYKG